MKHWKMIFVSIFSTLVVLVMVASSVLFFPNPSRLYSEDEGVFFRSIHLQDDGSVTWTTEVDLKNWWKNNLWSTFNPVSRPVWIGEDGSAVVELACGLLKSEDLEDHTAAWHLSTLTRTSEGEFGVTERRILDPDLPDLHTSDWYPSFIWMAPPRHLLFQAIHDPEVKLSRQEFVLLHGYPTQTSSAKDSLGWDQLIFYENRGDPNEKPEKFERYALNHYPVGDAGLLAWMYSEKNHGFFLVWEVHSKNQNELMYYDLETHQVVQVAVLSIMADGYCRLEETVNAKHVYVFGEHHCEIFSVPALKKVQNINLSKPLPISSCLTVSSDLRYLAYGLSEVSIMDLQNNKEFVIDALHSNQFNVGWIYLGEDVEPSMKYYRMRELKFVGESRKLAAISQRGEYYQWDVDQRKLKLYKQLDIADYRPEKW